MEKIIHTIQALLSIFAFLTSSAFSARCQTGQISVYPTVIEWSAGDMSPQEVRVTTNGTWVCDSLEVGGWLRLNGTTGFGTTTVTLTPFRANTSEDDWVDEVEFRCDGSDISASLTVIRRGRVYSVTTDKNTLRWETDETSAKTLRVTADSDWTVNVTGSDFSVIPTSGSGNGTLTVTPNGINNGPSERSAEIIVINHRARASVLLSQAVSEERIAIDGNWMLHRTYTKGDGATYIQDITFYNGLGYPEQIVQVGASPDRGRNMVTPVVYDRMMRPDAKEYLPYVSSSTSAEEESIGGVLSNQKNFYSSLYQRDGLYAFTETEYEPSPLGRPKKMWHAGAVFRDSLRFSTVSHGGNTSSEVRLLEVGIDGSLNIGGYYQPGTLYRESITDEDGRVTVIFKDRLDRVVMVRRMDDDISSDTYQVYDPWGNTAWVLQPEGSAALPNGNAVWTVPADNDVNGTLAARFCFVKIYDGLGRCLSSKVPGRAVEHYVYDRNGHVVMRQDGNMRENGGWWMTYSHDNHGRETSRGLIRSESYSGESGRLHWQEVYDGISSSNSSVTPQPDSLIAETIYSSLLFDIRYVHPASVTNTEDYSRINGFRTYERVRELGESIGELGGWVERSFYYDSLGRHVQTLEMNDDWSQPSSYLMSYDFQGKVLSSEERHWYSSNDSEDALVSAFNYDDRGRLLSESHSLNDCTFGGISYTYDALGRLAGKTFGSGSSTVAETLTYDIRGWLTGKTGNVFSESLRYTFPQRQGTAPCFTGSISEWGWSNGSGNEAYAFSYDSFGRLTDSRLFVGNATASLDSFSERDIAYDRNGNILSMTRLMDASTVPESLSFSYEGNRLAAVSRFGSYAHDVSGNLTHDGRNNLDISYDMLGMTSSVRKDGIILGSYTFLADGTKRSALKSNGTGYVYAGSMVYTRAASGSLSLDCVLTESGRLSVNYGADGSTSYRPLIHVTDHLGSVRAVVDASTGTVIERNDYLPFGMRRTTVNTTSGTASGSNASPNRWFFSGKESQSFLSADIPLLDFGARMYDPTTARWTAIDPMAEEYYSVSPYAYCVGDPIKNVDILGLRPIYSTEGYLLGTDDGGIQGEQIIMKKDNFVQGMRTEDALKYNLGVEGLDDEDAITRFNDSFNHLKDRPDWDGYITLKEANEWYRSGRGEPLFADINKIDFSSYVSLGEKYVGKTYVINLLNGKSKINDGLVYGKIVVKRYPNHGIRAYSDRYDFDIKRPYLLHIGRNIQTHIGAKVAGKGTDFNINIYGEKKLKPFLPWIK